MEEVSGIVIEEARRGVGRLGPARTIVMEPGARALRTAGDRWLRRHASSGADEAISGRNSLGERVGLMKMVQRAGRSPPASDALRLPPGSSRTPMSPRRQPVDPPGQSR